jgi:general secretion pathway protein G
MLRLVSAWRNKRGFTLIELLIVMTIVGILATIAVPSYTRSQIKARETVLMEDLYQMRSAIDAFFADRNRYPESLDELVSERYIRGIPRDPMTLSTESWTVEPPLPTLEGALAEGGVFDVRSGSDLVGLNGTPYNEW